MGVEVTEHGIGAPAANQLDCVGVDTSTKWGHGPGSAKAACFHFVWSQSTGLAPFANAPFDKGRNGGDAQGTAGALVAMGVEGQVRAASVTEQVANTPNQGKCGAEVRVARSAVACLLPRHSILLDGEGEGGASGGVQIHKKIRDGEQGGAAVEFQVG